jgi:hypothetical protein
MTTRSGEAGLAVVSAILLMSYLPDLGRGFVKDDFSWIAGSRVDAGDTHLEILRRHNGFYRPLVSLSFAVNEAVFGLKAYGYGLTNLLLVIVGMLGIFALGVSLRMPRPTAAIAGGLWALNPHGIGGSILWISGRTSLMLVAFAVVGAAAFVRGRRWAATALVLLAMLCKEEATLVPIILGVWSGWADEAPSRWSLSRSLRRSWPLATAWIVYFGLRLQTTAYLPWSAPSFYRPTFRLGTLVRNVLEYADRAATLDLAAVVLLVLLLQRWPRPDPKEWGLVARGVVWLVGGYGLTVFLPVRSSLYALLPAVGAALVAATLLGCLWRTASPRQRSWSLAGALILLLALVPLYRARNVRLVRLAELSARALNAVGEERAALVEGKALVLHDDLRGRANLREAFGTLVQDAVRLETGLPKVKVWVEPPLPYAAEAGLRPPNPSEGRIDLWLQNGALQRAPGPG